MKNIEVSTLVKRNTFFAAFVTASGWIAAAAPISKSAVVEAMAPTAVVMTAATEVTPVRTGA
jgi:hypothetical protein